MTVPHVQVANSTDLGDTVATYRHEMKFVFRYADATKLRTILSHRCTPLAFAGRISRVNSIYFDDVRLSGVEENIQGVGRRTKLRLRWYDEAMPTHRMFFEVKRRNGVMISKERIPLEAVTPGLEAPYRHLITDLHQALPTSIGGLLALRSEPTVIVEYKREHFVDPESSARLTLDYDITCFDQRGASAPTKRWPVSLEGLTVVEAKVPPGHEHVVPGLLGSLRRRVGRCSKYALSCLAVRRRGATTADW